MIADKGDDNGINIKFGEDRTKGEYRLVKPNNAAVLNGNGRKNGSAKRGTQVSKRHLCASCQALESSRASRPPAPRPGLLRRAGRAVKCLIRLVVFVALSFAIAYGVWMLYDEFFECLWAATQSVVYMSIALLFSSAALLNVCKNESKKSEMPTGDMVPPDGGWGWLVLISAIMVNLLIPGGIKSFGILYQEFLHLFRANPKTGAWIPALCYFLYSSLGPLSSILSVRYSYRTVTLIGGTFAGVGMMLSFFAGSIEYLYVSYGIFVGIGAGLAFPPTVYIVTSYFDRYRGLANGFCISGSALGSIILPPVMVKMIKEFGVRYTILAMGALTLNVWACALIYDPVEKHMKPARKSLPTVLEEALEPLAEADIDIAVTSPEDEKRNPLISPSSDNQSSSNGEAKGASPIVPKSASSAALEHYYKPTSQSRTRKISMPVGPRDMAGQMHSTPALHGVPERRYRYSRPPPLSPSTSSFNYISTPYHGSTLTTLHPEFASTLTLNAITSTFRKSPEKHAKSEDEVVQPRAKFFDFSLLRDPMYLVILISNSTNAISYTNFVIVLTLYATQLGFTTEQGSMLLSCVSLLDLIGRIGGAALSDFKIMPKHWYFVGGLFLSGISLAILPTAKSFLMCMFFCCCFGISSGVYVGVTAVVMADMLGVEKLTSSYGISLFVNGVLQLIGPPICGTIGDALNDWGPIFTVLGFVLIAGAGLWGFVPFIRKYQRAEAKRIAAAASPPPEKI